MPEFIKIRNTTDAEQSGIKPGCCKMLPVDADGLPLDQFWRRRLKDARRDNAFEIVKRQDTPPVTTVAPDADTMEVLKETKPKKKAAKKAGNGGE